MESRESSSPIITRAVAAGLQGRYSDPYQFTPLQKTALKGIGFLPQGLSRWIIPRLQASGGLDARMCWDLLVDDLIHERLKDYEQLEGRYPAVTVGVGQGGTTAHLSMALGGPFLPQAFVLTIKGGSSDGNARNYFQRSAELARHLADQNQNILTIQHYDPVHDGWLTRRMNHVRLKLLDLPQAYKNFLRDKLEPGGEVLYLEGDASWLRYRISGRCVFQVGGWGDLSAEEYLQGSERIRQYCKKEGLQVSDWRLEDYPLERGPESEWGSEPGLGEALADFCQREGYRFTCISLPEPNEFSRLAFKAISALLQKTGQPPAGILVEMFSQFDATAVIKSGLLPLWLVFNTWDSLAFLKEMTREFPSGLPVFFSPLSTFSITPDLVPWQSWAEALQDFDWVNIGARRSHYPSDTRALVEGTRMLRNWCAAHPNPLRGRLTGEELKKLS